MIHIEQYGVLARLYNTILLRTVVFAAPQFSIVLIEGKLHGNGLIRYIDISYSYILV